ncbi:MAG: YfhO family protein, partial [Anaerolineales bacterium]|nr:YfhO family protein [Anaerolineales bacterium]
MDKIHNKHLIPIILVPLILFSPLIVSGKALFWGTTSTQFVPWWDFAWETVLKGQLPLWNPWVGMGAPLIANYQSALFYPPYWITLLAYSFGGTQWMAWSISLVVVFHLIWSGIGTAKLLEEMNTGKLGQAIGGLAFSLSGYLVARAGFLSINAAAAWLPWILLYVTRLTIGKKGSFWTLVLVFSFQLLAGHAQTTWYSILLGGIWLIFKLITKSNIVDGLKNNVMCLLQFIAAGILSAGISAVQLIPTIEYLFQSQRAGEYGYVEAMTYSFWPWRFLTLFVPDLFGSPALGNYWGYGNYWEDAVYIGLVPILLALGLIFRVLFGRKKEILSKNNIEVHHTVYFLICITGVSFLFALGKNTGIFPFLYRHIPTFDLFQAPTRFSIWAV